MQNLVLAQAVDPDPVHLVDELAEPLLVSKFLLPRLPTRCVPRARLLDAVSQSVAECPLTLITAVAGSGKSIVASSWAQERSRDYTVAWLSMDEADDVEERFWPYVFEALRRAGVALRHADEWISGGSRRSLLVRLTADLLDHPEPVVVVLDGFEAVCAADLLDSVDFLIRHAFLRLRLVITSRVEPMLPLHRYRLSGDIAEIGPEALAFSTEEVAAYLTRLGFALGKSTAQEWVEATGGWVAGLRLATMAFKGRGVYRPEPSASVALSIAAIAEYVMTDVLLSAPVKHRNFLRHTSVCEVLTADLADELTGGTDSATTLAELAHANFLVEAPGADTSSYRGAELIRRSLLSQYSQDCPERVVEMHVRAARWLAARGQPLDALQHAVAARNWDLVTALVLDSLMIGAVVVSADRARYAAALESLPDGLSGAGAALIRAAVAFVVAQDDAAAVATAAAAAEVQGQAQAGTVSPELRLSLAVVQGLVCARSGDGPAARAAAREGSQLLSELPAARVRACPELPAVLQYVRAAGLFWDGEHVAAVAELEIARRMSESTSAVLASACRGLLGLAEALRGQLRRASELTRTGEVETQTATGFGQTARLALAWTHAERYDLMRARRYVEGGGDGHTGPLAILFGLINIRLARWGGGVGVARRLLDQLGPADGAPGWVRELLLLEAAELELASGRAELAVSTIDAVPDASSPRAMLARARALANEQRPQPLPDDLVADETLALDLRVGLWLHQCRCYLARTDEQSATKAIERALALARPEQLRHPFLQSGTEVRRFLRQRIPADGRSVWLDPRGEEPAAVRRTAPARDDASEAVVEQLSKRELEVLRYLAEPRSTEEIAAAMFVSVNTVRTHVRAILRKLGVRRRNDAVRRARELQLV